VHQGSLEAMDHRDRQVNLANLAVKDRLASKLEE
jgi:hypothetical protein